MPSASQPASQPVSESAIVRPREAPGITVASRAAALRLYSIYMHSSRQARPRVRGQPTARTWLRWGRPGPRPQIQVQQAQVRYGQGHRSDRVCGPPGTGNAGCRGVPRCPQPQWSAHLSGSMAPVQLQGPMRRSIHGKSGRRGISCKPNMSRGLARRCLGWSVLHDMRCLSPSIHL